MAVGAFLNSGGMGVADFNAAKTLWETWTGRNLTVTRKYKALSSFGYGTDADLLEMIASGVKICLTLRPAFNPVSSTDLANMTTFLTSLKASGANVDITLWHEPFFSGLSNTQYVAMVNFYGPTVRSFGFPLVFVPSASAVDSTLAGGYYPGDSAVDKIAVDMYAYSWNTGSTLDSIAAIADGASPPKSLGLWEGNGSTDPVNGQTQTVVTNYFAYLQSFFGARAAAGKPNGDILLFNSGQANALGNNTNQQCGFEGGISPWQPSGGCTIAASSAQSHSGTGAMRMTATGVTNMSARQNTQANFATGLAVTPGQIVSTSMWSRAVTVARNCQATIEFYTSTGTLVSTSSGTPAANTTTAFTQISQSNVTVPATAARAFARVQVNSPAGAGEQHDIDDVNLVIDDPSPNQVNCIDFSWDYRIGLYQALSNANAIVNTWTYSQNNNYVYGSVQIPVANNLDGSGNNWLFAVVGWNSTENYAVPWAADTAHNNWRALGITGTNDYRVAVLACPRALATTQVTISSSDWIRSPNVIIYEVTGLAAGLTVDSMQVRFSAGATSQSVPTTTTATDFCLTAMAANTTATFSINTAAGWSTPTDLNSTNANGNCQLLASPQLANTSPTAIWTASASRDIAAIAVAVQPAATTPSNPNPSLPYITVNAAFGHTPGSVTTYPTWTDISSRVISIDGERGRQFEMNAMESGTCDLILDNLDGAFNPLNSASPYYPNVQNGTPIQVLATWQGRTYPVFTGHVVDWTQNYDFNYGLVKATCADSYEPLTQVLLGSAMDNEILFDKPWAYWPLFDGTGSTATMNLSGRSQGPLYPQTNLPSKPASFAVTPSPALAGDTATVWQQAGLTAGVGNGFGTSLEMLPDPTFPGFTNGFTAEAWCQAATSQPGGATTFIFCLKNLEAALNTGGQIARVGFENTTNFPSVSVSDSTGAFNVTVFGSTSIADNKWHHHCLTVSGSTWTYYLDGAQALTGTITWYSTSPTVISFNGCCDSLTQGHFGNLTLAKTAVYDRVLDPERITAHYQSGATGFANEGAGARISRFLTYANWGTPQQIDPGNSQMQQLNYLAGGYGSNGITGSFGGYTNTATLAGGNPAGGSQADVAVSDIALSDNGILYVDHNDALTYKGRWQVYNSPVMATFGDQGGSQIPYQGDIAFDYGVQYIYDDVTVTRNTNNIALRVFSPGAVLKYKNRALPVTVYTAPQAGNPDLTNLANWLTNTYSSPAPRIGQMTVDVASAPAAWGPALQLDILDTVTVLRTAPGQPQISLNCLLLQVQFHIEAGQASFEYVMSPVLAPVLTLDDPIYGIVGNNVLGW